MPLMFYLCFKWWFFCTHLWYSQIDKNTKFRTEWQNRLDRSFRTFFLFQHFQMVKWYVVDLNRNKCVCAICRFSLIIGIEWSHLQSCLRNYRRMCFCYCSHIELCDLDAICVEICALFPSQTACISLFLILYAFNLLYLYARCTLHIAQTEFLQAERKTTNERSLYNVWMITDYGYMHCRWLLVCLKRWKRAWKYSFLLLISVFVAWASNCTRILFPYYYYYQFAFYFPFFSFVLFLLSEVSTEFFLKNSIFAI